MKKLCVLLLVLTLLFSSAHAQTEDDFSYSISSGEAKITAYTGSASDLTLPSSLGGYPVTAIGVCAFRNCTSLKRVVIPDGVTRIGSNAFQNCTALAQLVIPDSLNRIDTHAFYGCCSLSQLPLHDGIGHINILAFYGCPAVRLCDSDSQTACTLTNAGYFFTDPGEPLLSLRAYEDGSGQRTFTVADCDESAVSVALPARVTAIERNAFLHCSTLTEVILPDGVTEIASSAFADCPMLRQITLPGSIQTIAGDAFSGCTDVTVTAPSGSAGQTLAEENAAEGFLWQAL